MRGPMGKPKNRVENPGKLLKRLMDYIFRDYKFHCIIHPYFCRSYCKCSGNDVHKRFD